MGIIASVVTYGALFFFAADIPFLNRMAITLGVVMVSGVILTILKPLAEPVKMPTNDEIVLESSQGAKLCGIGVCVLTVILYIVFW